MIEYKIGTNCIDWSQLCDMYAQIGLVGGFGKQKDYDGIKSAFLNSFRVVTAWDGRRLVGACRLISDGVCYATVFDVAVLPEYRRQGIATRILEELLKDCEKLSIHLTSIIGIEGLYKKLGFRRHKNALARYPNGSEYLSQVFED